MMALRGAPLSAEALDRLVTGVPDTILLVVDEAYAEFNAFEGGGDALPHLARRKGPWISTRTFSKAYSLAGLRLGYALCSDAAIAEGLVKVKCNFNLNRLAVHAGRGRHVAVELVARNHAHAIVLPAGVVAVVGVIAFFSGGDDEDASPDTSVTSGAPDVSLPAEPPKAGAQP